MSPVFLWKNNITSQSTRSLSSDIPFDLVHGWKTLQFRANQDARGIFALKEYMINANLYSTSRLIDEILRYPLCLPFYWKSIFGGWTKGVLTSFPTRSLSLLHLYRILRVPLMAQLCEDIDKFSSRSSYLAQPTNRRFERKASMFLFSTFSEAPSEQKIGWVGAMLKLRSNGRFIKRVEDLCRQILLECFPPSIGFVSDPHFRRDYTRWRV